MRTLEQIINSKPRGLEAFVGCCSCAYCKYDVKKKSTICILQKGKAVPYYGICDDYLLFSESKTEFNK